MNTDPHQRRFASPFRAGYAQRQAPFQRPRSDEFKFRIASKAELQSKLLAAAVGSRFEVGVQPASRFSVECDAVDEIERAFGPGARDNRYSSRELIGQLHHVARTAGGRFV